ncbi:MAG: YfhO family protein [Anaerostipes sp.]|jgi:uncharacterized membrane protein YfhO
MKNKRQEIKKSKFSDMSAGKVFGLACLVSLLFFLPFMGKEHGAFLYYGDYLLQQIPFYTGVHEAVRNGQLFLNFATDLGSSLYTSYSFYLLGSPFFWVTIPFSKAMLPALMSGLLVIKFGLSAMFAYLYIKKYTKKSTSAVIGAILYAFSGYSITSIVFNHFLDVIVFFPVYLILLEKLVEEKKRGWFAVFTAFTAILNYYFFIAEVLFLIIYAVSKYILGFHEQSMKERIKGLVPVFIEGIIGTLISGAFLLPSLITVVGNQRVSNVISGKGMIIYDELKVYTSLLKNLFLPPDLIAIPTLFSNELIANSSMALFLPLFSFSGVIAFYYITKGKKKTRESMDSPIFMRRLLVICLIFALVPVLNSLFSGGNSSYYARWFFMPILIMAVMTVYSLEEFEQRAYAIGAGVCVIAELIFIVIGIFTNGGGSFSEAFVIQNRSLYQKELIVPGVCLLILIYLVFILNKDKQMKYLNAFLVGTIFCSVVFSYLFIYEGYYAITQGQRKEYKAGMALETSLKEIREQPFSRVELEYSQMNFNMFWNLPSTTSFISTIPASLFDFYDFVDIERSVKTILPKEKEGLRMLLSSRYYLQYKEGQPVSNQKVYEPVEGYKKIDEKNGFVIYENKNALSMGTFFTHYMKLSEYKKLSKKQRDKVLLHALVFSNEECNQIKKDTSMTELNAKQFIESQGKTTVESAAEKLNQNAAKSIQMTDRKITLKVSKDKEGLCFLSVPYSKGFLATIDGKTTQIRKADQGLMAVKVPKGSSEIVFTYEEPGLKIGIICSVLGMLLLILRVKWKRNC